MISLTVFLLLLASVSSNNTTFPVHYQITIVPQFSDLTFSSETKITIVVEEPINSVTLNSRNLQIENLTVLNSADEEVNGADYSVNGESETIDVTFSSELEEGLYNLIFKASGNINENTEGFYASEYRKPVAEENRTILLTNFKYDKAREVFPCFDGLTQLSTFILKLVRPNDYISVSNTAVVTSVNYDENRTIDVFAVTDPIPPYHLSFAIIDFETKDFEGTTVYSVSSEETEYLGQLSSQVSEKFQELYSFNIGNINQIVVSDNSLSTDVVDNIGLIIYRESAVVYNKERESIEDKQAIAKVVALSMVNQYQRDSFEWWPNFWAKIGTLVSYQYEVLDKLNPTWKLYEQFVTEELLNLLEYDVGENEVSIMLPDDKTPDVFTNLQLLKSFSFVQMFSHLPTPGNILEDETNPIARSWIDNKGYPILTATRTYNSVNNSVSFDQGNEVLRSIPINIVFENQETSANSFDFVLETNDVSRNYQEQVSSSWFIVNSERLGYYRVNYDTTNWQSLALFLSTSRNDIGGISPANRAVLLEDSLYFNLLGQTNITVYLELIQYLKRETDFIPLYAFIKTANKIKSLLAQDSIQATFMDFATDLIQHLYEHIGTTPKEEESHVDTLSRIKILTWLCSFGYAKCQEEMHEILSKSEAVEPNLQELVYCGGLRLGNIDRFGFVKDQHVAHGKKRILRSLGCTSNTDILQYYITAVVDQSPIVHLQQEDKVDAFLAVLEGSDAGVDVALTFAKQYLEQILIDFSDEDIGTMFTALSKKLVTDAQHEMINAIVECLTDEQNVTFGALFEAVNNNILENKKWRSLNIETMRRWFDNEITSSAPSTTTPRPTENTTIPDTTTPSTPPPDGAAADLKVSVILLLVFVFPFISS